MIELRPYQQEGIERIADSFRRGNRRTVYVLPTGGGKSFTFCAIAARAVAKGHRVLILVHRQELLAQASAALTQWGIKHSMIGGKHRNLRLEADVIVGMVDTIDRRRDQIAPTAFDLIIADEAHHAVCASWARVMRHFDGAHGLGFTATPCRLDGRGLGEYFEDLVLGPSPEWLTTNGYLAEAEIWGPPIGRFGEAKLAKRGGDFSMGEAAQQFEAEAKFHGDLVGHYRAKLEGRTAIAFCCTIAHATGCAGIYQAGGVPAEVIHGEMSGEERQAILGRLGAGETKIVTNCALVGEGVDIPSVAGVIHIRPTMSYSLFLQMVGRGLRPDGTGQKKVILDHVKNYDRHGHHLDVPEWSLDGKQKSKGAAPIRTCEECFATVPANSKVCPECGAAFGPTEAEKKAAKESQRALVEYERQRGIRDRKVERARAETLEDLIAIGAQRGYRNPRGWAYHVMKARGSRSARQGAYTR